MSRTRMLIVAFWVFIVSMLLWQFYSYNQGLKQAAIDHPQQTHFWFTNSSHTVVAPQPSRRDGADVAQTAFAVEDNMPATGSFTCHVTLKNNGNAKALNVQVSVRPYRGTSKFDEDVGHSATSVLSDNDPVSLFGEWVSFPDLAPGESNTQSVVFSSRTNVKPGSNPKAKILFDTEKPKPHVSGGSL